MSSSSTTSVLTIILNAFQKMGPRSWLNNPMLAVVFITACLATALFLKELNLPTGNASLYAQMLFWIWMTLFFSTLADSYAESKLSYKDLPHKQKISTLLVKRLAKISNIETFKEIELSRVKSGNFLLLRSGDIVPFDGIIVKGICYVNETSITGGLDNTLKNPEESNILTAGTIITGNDWIFMKVSFAGKFSFFARAKRILKNINRQSLPSELALKRLILGLSVLFFL